MTLDKLNCRKGDWGRDLALHIGRMRCGLTLRELGERVGGLTVAAVAKACERMAERLETDKTVRRASARVMKMLAERKAVVHVVACRQIGRRGGWIRIAQLSIS